MPIILRKTTFYPFLFLLGGLVVFNFALWAAPDAAAVSILGAIVLTVFVLAKWGRDYLSPAVSFCLPWFGILICSGLEVSSFSRSLNPYTYQIILTTLIVALGVFSVSSLPAAGGLADKGADGPDLSLNHVLYGGVVIGYILFTLLNVYLAGFIPLLGKQSEYLEFGVKGIYGLYNAFGNAFALLNLYLFLRTGRKRFLIPYLAVLAAFVLFVTRQNVISTLTESFVIYSLMNGRIRRAWLAAMLLIALVLFSVAGEMRSGKIDHIVGINSEYEWLPSAAVWLYAYSYFNVLNFNNLVERSVSPLQPRPPYYDGSSLAQLMPSVMRPDSTAEYVTYLEVQNLTVPSYMFPIYQDVGFTGVLLFTAAVCLVTSYCYNQAAQSKRFLPVCSYGVLYYCALLSFFINFWFYLPVIFQLVFLKVFSASVVGERRSQGAPPESLAEAAYCETWPSLPK